MFVLLEPALPIINNDEMNEQQQQSRRQPRLCLGDLNSGRAFDNNCICFENVYGFRRQECTCNVIIKFLLHIYCTFINK